MDLSERESKLYQLGEVMFKICDARGFHITFENGWTASIQWGAGNYCDNHYASFNEQREIRDTQSTVAEIAAWPRSGSLVELDNDNTVKGWQSPEEVLEFLNWVSTQSELSNDLSS